MHLITSRISHPSFIANHKSGIQHPLSIKNIIFDFGGVICNIDVKLTEKAFIGLGSKKFDTRKSIASSSGLFEKIETGAISPEQFRSGLRRFFTHSVSDDQLDDAWNALLLDIPPPRIRLLEKIRSHYRIFLLSNSNEIHYRKYLSNFTREFGYKSFDDLFEKAYFSFNVGLKKPGKAIFDYVIANSNLNPNETLFVDDTLIHVEGASQAQINGCHLNLSKGEQIIDLFEK
jgi:putative hydrolase of the HAD superfamily